MTRPLRIEYPGALYHVTSRGDRKSAIFRDDTDRAMWLQTLAEVCAHFRFSVHAFCQMGNHYHLLVETLDGKLAQGMRQLNGVYSQYFNRRHKLVGHVFQGRYQAILVERQNYLLELSRYIVLNPVRAGMVGRPEDWPWSNFNYVCANNKVPLWLDIVWLLSNFSPDRKLAIDGYKIFVLAGMGLESPLKNTYRQLILGSQDFIARHQQANDASSRDGITKIQRSAVSLSLAAYQERFPDRDLAMAEAYRSRAYTLTEIARHFGVAHTTVSRAVKKHR
ncbi:transposase [Duganella radicis]|uniref:Addiction module toxin RelE n=1 Tax=Duganella radicis TaxID=551988 RepID=A0A6L6PC02_9BURK|nr:transposase [Duganella radicis]MTV36097.1 addiction module toxin RelE [Duganella radicis]